MEYNDVREKANVLLVPIAPHDIATVARLHASAFKSDQFSNLMLLNRDDSAFVSVMHRSTEDWLSDPAA